MRAYWRFARYMLRYRLQMAVAFVFAVLAATLFGAGIGLFLPILRGLFGKQGLSLQAMIESKNQAPWWDHVIPDVLIPHIPSDQFGSVIALVVALVVFSALSGITRFAHAYMAMRVAALAVADIRVVIFKRLMSLPMRTIIRETLADRMSRVLQDAEHLSKGFSSLIAKLVGTVFRGLAPLAIALYVDWKFTLIALAVAPFCLWVARLYSAMIRRRTKRTLKDRGHLLAAITESMQGLSVVKVHTAEEIEAKRFRRVVRNLLRAQFALRRSRAAGPPIIEFIGVIGFGAAIIFAGWQISNDAPGESFLGVLLLLAVSSLTLRPMTMMLTDIQEAAAAADRIDSLLLLTPESVDDAGKEEKDDFRRSLEFDNVSFRYPGSEVDAVHRVTQRIKRGQTVAFVGGNGSGKSTLLSLVPRLFDPHEGHIRIDGRDICDFTLASLRRCIAMVTQNTVLFNDTIANNIAYGTNDVRQEEIEQAARQAYAHDFIMAKPGGYDTNLGEQGQLLSGGERQRLAIARAILRDPEILILDEATSMIDADSEAKISAALNEFCKDRTSLVIAHRLSTVVDADRIVVLDQGCVIDSGTHHELLDRCLLYQQLCRTQLISSSPITSANGSAG